MNRVFLLLEFLNGSKDAQAILADIIEDDGDEYLANRVSSRKRSSRKHLQLVLEVVPFRMGTILGIEFLEHAISFGPPLNEFESFLNEAKQWVLSFNGPETQAELHQNAPDLGRRRSWIPFRNSSPTNIERAFEKMQETLLAFTWIIKWESRLNSFRARKSNNRLRTALNRLANDCRRIPNARMRRRHGNRYSERGQMDWQWAHVLGALESKVANSS